MALGRKCGSKNEGFGLGLVRCTSFGRKRVFLLNDMEVEDDDSTVITPTKKHCNQNSLLESMPQDILIRILCKVEHGDLKRLFRVSKLIREMTLIAKKWHFEYSTPRKTLGFRDCFDLEDSCGVEAPNAPKQTRIPRVRLTEKKLADISVALFASPENGRWKRRKLEMETDI